MAGFHAHEDALMCVIAHAENRCLEFGLGHASIHRVVLVLEELFLNAVKHGRAGESSDPSIHVDLSVVEGELELRFEDGGVDYDPFQGLSEVSHRLSMAERRVGGLGVVLVDGLVLRRSYQREGARNRIRLWLEI